MKAGTFMKIEIENEINKCVNNKGFYNILELKVIYKFDINNYDQNDRKEISDYFRNIESNNKFVIAKDQAYGYEELFLIITGEEFNPRRFLTDLKRFNLNNLRNAYLDLINEESGSLMNNRFIPYSGPFFEDDEETIIEILNLDNLNVDTKIMYMKKNKIKISNESKMTKILDIYVREYFHNERNNKANLI